MPSPSSAQQILSRLTAVAQAPMDYASAWKQRTEGLVIGVLPMNFPLELVHAARALPSLLQEGSDPITVGRSMLFEFYCGYSRSLVDQAMMGQYDGLDGIFLVDHCVALLGAADAIRFQKPDMPVFLAQFVAAMDEDTSRPEIRSRILDLRGELERLTGNAIADDAIAGSIRLYDLNRSLQRYLYGLRRNGRISLTSGQMQAIVKSSMVMDVEEHTELLKALIVQVEHDDIARVAAPLVKLHLSGHFCHAPRPELLAMIEDCGATIVDDDLFTGRRFIETDVGDGAAPIDALTDWYFARNTALPCATRAQRDVDWETYLASAVEDSGADGVIVLMAKFCEPHMLYFPELRKELNRRSIPFLLIETEHEGLALEMLRTRVEALVERIHHSALTRPEPSPVP